MPKKILIVEDYEDSRTLMKYLLETYGFQVIEAKDGIEAFDKFKQFHPDLILMDLSLPVVDGLMATKAIRQCGGEEVPIIAVTAFGKLYYRKAIEAGCKDLIGKPLDFDSFEPIVNNYLNGH
jgi:Response regulators consisting of a CheY-like receiver domain and a winged-helix DNA-binding domain